MASIDEGTANKSLKIHQDAQISRLNLAANTSFDYPVKSSHHGVYVMQIYGASKIDTTQLQSRDAVGISETDDFKIEASEDSQLLFIEVPVTFNES